MPREHASCLPSHLLYVNAFSPMDLSSSPLGMVYGVMDTAVLWIMGHKPSSLLLCVCFKNKQYAWRMWTMDGMSRNEQRARISFYSSPYSFIPTLILFNLLSLILYTFTATSSFVKRFTALYTVPWCCSTMTTKSSVYEARTPSCWCIYPTMNSHSPQMVPNRSNYSQFPVSPNRECSDS